MKPQKKTERLISTILSFLLSIYAKNTILLMKELSYFQLFLYKGWKIFLKSWKVLQLLHLFNIHLSRYTSGNHFSCHQSFFLILIKLLMAANQNHFRLGEKRWRYILPYKICRVWNSFVMIKTKSFCILNSSSHTCLQN